MLLTWTSMYDAVLPKFLQPGIFLPYQGLFGTNTDTSPRNATVPDRPLTLTLFEQLHVFELKSPSWPDYTTNIADSHEIHTTPARKGAVDWRYSAGWGYAIVQASSPLASNWNLNMAYMSPRGLNCWTMQPVSLYSERIPRCRCPCILSRFRYSDNPGSHVFT